jgi:Transcriptional regulators
VEIMATRNDVAKKAEVSVATVSHVINNSKYVSPELKEKVNEAIRVLNYKPNMVARSLVTKITKHVGIIVNDITNPYYGEIAQGMEEVAHKHGYIISLCLASGDSDSYLASIKQRQMDGIFMATTRNEDFNREQFQNLVDSGIAVVNGHGVGSEVNFAYKKAIYNLVKYLVDLGHKRIGYLSGISLDLPGNDRYVLYKEALEKNGIDFDNRWAVDGMYPYKTDNRSGYEAMNHLLGRDTRVTAVITTNDYMAFGAIKAVREAGLEVPEDISVAGCDDVFLAECIDPPLTTIRVPKKELGRQAMYMLISAINEKKNSSLMLEADLVIRGSTGLVKSV